MQKQLNIYKEKGMVMIIGDMNGRMYVTGDKNDNAMGRALEKFIVKNAMNIANINWEYGTKTYTRNGGSSIIDLCLTTNDKNLIKDYFIDTDNIFKNDHRPQCITIRGNILERMEDYQYQIKAIPNKPSFTKEKNYKENIYNNIEKLKKLLDKIDFTDINKTDKKVICNMAFIIHTSEEIKNNINTWGIKKIQNNNQWYKTNYTLIDLQNKYQYIEKNDSY